MSARYDAMVEAWERANGRAATLSVRRRLQAMAYVPSKYGCCKDAESAELCKLIQEQTKDRKDGAK